MIAAVALVFGGVGMALAYLTGGLAKQFAPSFLLVLFALLRVVRSPFGHVLVAIRENQQRANEGGRSVHFPDGNATIARLEPTAPSAAASCAAER